MVEEKTEAELAAEKEAEEEAEAEKAKAESETQDAEFEDSLKDLTDEEKEVKREERKKASDIKTKEIDWKAKHDEEKERADAADKALANDRYKQDEARRKAEEDAKTTEDDDDDEEDKPLTKADFQAERAKDRQIMQKQLQKQEADSIVKGMTDNVDEQNYVLEIHKNRTFPENLSLKDQLEEAYAIANKDKWKGERDEAMRKAKGDKSANTDGATAHRKAPESKAGEPLMSAEDKQSLVSKGWKWNTTNKRYEKSTSTGIALYRDPKTGSVKTVK